MTQSVTFDWAGAIATRPSYDQRNAFYGSYTYRTLDNGWVEPNPIWIANNLVDIPATQLPGFPALYGTLPRRFITMHKRVAPVMVATWAELARRGLVPRLRTFDGAFAARHILNDPTRALSNHAKGSAVDFDARWNGYGLAPGLMQIDRDVVRCFEECGWAWGGRWSPSDGMHFEWIDQEPHLAQPHQDALGRVEPKVAPNPRAVPVPEPLGITLNAERLFVDGQLQGTITKATLIGGKIYVKLAH